LFGEGERAIEIIDEHIGETDDPDVLATRGMALYIAGRGSEAYDCVAKSWATDPSDAGARANYACISSLAAAATGRSAEAVSFGDEVGRIGGSYLDQIRAHLGRAFGYAQLGEDVKAKSAIASARRIVDPSEDEVHRGLVRLAQAVVGTARGWDDAMSVSGPLETLSRLGVTAEAWEKAFRGSVSSPDEPSRLFA
jgi:hypothetical protein